MQYALKFFIYLSYHLYVRKINAKTFCYKKLEFHRVITGTLFCRSSISHLFYAMGFSSSRERTVAHIRSGLWESTAIYGMRLLGLTDVTHGFPFNSAMYDK